MTIQPHVLAVLNARWWLPAFSITALLVCLAITPNFDAKRQAADHLARLHAEKAALALDVAALQEAPLLAPLRESWRALALIAETHGTRLSVTDDSKLQDVWPITPTPAWHGAVTGAPLDVLAVVFALRPRWNSFRPVRFHTDDKGQRATVLIAVYGREAGETP